MKSPENYEKCGESVQCPVGGWPPSLHRSKHARGGPCVWHRGKHLREIPRDIANLIAAIDRAKLISDGFISEVNE
jgi:hypothetical protein